MSRLGGCVALSLKALPLGLIRQVTLQAAVRIVLEGL